VEALAARSGVGAGAFVVGAGDLVASAALAIRNITVGTQVGEGSAGLRRLRALVVGASERVHAALPLTDVAIRAFRGNEATSTAGSSVYPCCACPRTATNLDTTRVPGLQAAFAAGSNSAGHRQERYQAGAQDHELDCRSCHGCEGAETGVGSAMEAPNL